MKAKLKKINKKIIDTISKICVIEETVFFIGLIIITFTNFLLNFFLGMYFLGMIFIAYSIFLYKVNRGEVRK